MYKLLAIIIGMCFSVPCFAQSELPATPIKNLAGKEIPFNKITAGADTLTVVSFWATWCLPCIAEMEAINDQLADRQKDVVFKFIAISIDDARTSAKVRAFVKGKGWDFPVYSDPNNALKRDLNINDIPHILIIKNDKIVYRHTGYVPGNEDELFAKLKSL